MKIFEHRHHILNTIKGLLKDDLLTRNILNKVERISVNLKHLHFITFEFSFAGSQQQHQSIDT